MIIKILLLCLLALIALVVMLQHIASRGTRLTVLATLAAGAYFVWQPDHANAVARVLGVGRGADLLMYLWVVITFSVMLLLYLKIIGMSRMLTQLARQLALSQPLQPPNRSKALHSSERVGQAAAPRYRSGRWRRRGPYKAGPGERPVQKGS